MKEAISSVIFASARCEDIPELKDVSKHFTAKYGKEFTSASLELRPNCGVGRMVSLYGTSTLELTVVGMHPDFHSSIIWHNENYIA